MAAISSIYQLESPIERRWDHHSCRLRKNTAGKVSPDPISPG